jgi:hypothetical protein
MTTVSISPPGWARARSQSAVGQAAEPLPGRARSLAGTVGVDKGISGFPSCRPATVRTRARKGCAWVDRQEEQETGAILVRVWTV